MKEKRRYVVTFAILHFILSELNNVRENSLDLVTKNFSREQKRRRRRRNSAPCSRRDLLPRPIEHKPLFTRYVLTIAQRRKNHVSIARNVDIIETVYGYNTNVLFYQ